MMKIDIVIVFCDVLGGRFISLQNKKPAVFNILKPIPQKHGVYLRKSLDRVCILLHNTFKKNSTPPTPQPTSQFIGY